jgi:hypothetical protein
MVWLPKDWKSKLGERERERDFVFLWVMSIQFQWVQSSNLDIHVLSTIWRGQVLFWWCETNHFH